MLAGRATLPDYSYDYSGMIYMIFFSNLLTLNVLTACVIFQVQVTRLVEARMMQQPSRAAAYRRYQEMTPMWLGFAIHPKQ